MALSLCCSISSAEPETDARGGAKTTSPKPLEARVTSPYAGLPPPVADYRKQVKSTDLKTYARAALALRRWMLDHDPHRPLYHFTAPESWLNDPNGPIYHQGKYHLFYQFDPMLPDGRGGWRRSGLCWGHAVSTNLVHWVDWPVALWPDTPHDRGGVYSGNVVIDAQGFPCALYTGNVAGHQETYGLLARSTDGWLTWQKRMVMDNAQRPNPDSPVHWDGQLWRDGDQWCQLIGGTTGGPTPHGAAWLWTSPDLNHWTLRQNIAPSIAWGSFWELPYLITLGDKQVLLVGSDNPYWVGTYDPRAMRFTPDELQPKSIDNGTYYSFNLNMTDYKGPGGAKRQLMHGWVTGPESPTQTVPYWQGAHSIPRVLSLRAGHVVQQPIPELQLLRGQHHQRSGVLAEPGQSGYLPEVQGDALELLACFDRPASAATRFGLKLRLSPDDRQGIRVWYEAKTDQFGLEGKVTKIASAWGGLTRDGTTNQPVTLHIFLDRSILEVYCGGAALTDRTFSNPKALGLDLFAEGGPARLRSLDVWKMHSMWDGPSL